MNKKKKHITFNFPLLVLNLCYLELPNILDIFHYKLDLKPKKW